MNGIYLIENGVASFDTAKGLKDVEPLEAGIVGSSRNPDTWAVTPLTLKLVTKLPEHYRSNLKIFEGLKVLFVHNQALHEAKQELQEIEVRFNETGIEDADDILLAWVIQQKLNAVNN